MASSNAGSWTRSRFGLAAFFLLSLVAINSVLRGVLFLSFKPVSVSVLTAWKTFLIGLHLDFFAGLLLTLPLLGWLVLISDRRFGSRWHRIVLRGGLFLFWTVQVFTAAAEYFFFEEFKSRYNTVAVDYLIYPQEVFINIWREYPVPTVVLGCAVCAGVWLAAASVLFRRMWDTPASLGLRLGHLAGAGALVAAVWPTVSFNRSHFSSERVLNEIANNSVIAFTAAAWTRQLDFAEFYKTLPADEAWSRARKIVQEPGTEFTEGGHSIRRRVTGDLAHPRLNVVIFLEESLGSEFFGCLGRAGESLTPELDRLALQEGLLFTNIYASGNRTVRGFEGVLSSFPPMPGDSIVKRHLSDNVETIARILKRDGYRTLFMYGGRGVFDGMRSFAVRNGYDRFIEQKDFLKPEFATIWGVSDGDLVKKAVEELHAQSQTGEPFLATILSVSNHKPYTYPKGCISEDPDARTREHAVKYCDYTLGQFFKAARQAPFYTNTIFVVVADHGARVFGSQSVPIRSYEIPLIILGPAVVRQPARVPQLGCSLDVSPTVLGLIGRPYDSLFFGRDLLKDPAAPGRALLNHNRDVGLYRDQRLVVLGLQRHQEFYTGDPKTGQMQLLRSPGPADLNLQKEAISLYQVADDLYIHGRYRLDP